MAAPRISVKRVYEPAAQSDGFRILVDRLWPRGISKANAGVDAWLKDAAPSNDLRKWFAHDPARWDEFRAKYREELESSGALEPVRALVREHKTVTLLFATRDTEHNNAVALAEFLKQ